jgi:hypothetical protein
MEHVLGAMLVLKLAEIWVERMDGRMEAMMELLMVDMMADLKVILSA